jgi:hypothetical protein
MKYLFLLTIGFVLGVVLTPSPKPSVEHVQREINRVINPALFQPLEVDGVAGSKTCEAWMFYSVGWEAYNDTRRKVD